MNTCARSLLTDAVWQTIKDYLAQHKGKRVSDEMRTWLEQNTQVTSFDGGAFVAIGNEFDLFVEPARRGRWRIRSTVNEYLDQLGRLHGKIIAKINEDNAPSLRLARHFGFQEVSRENGVIRMEKNYG